jgi:integrase
MEAPESSGKSVLRWMEPTGELTPENARQLAAWSALAVEVYPQNTLRAWKADWALYKEWADQAGRVALPATPETVAAFVAYCSQNRKPASIRRYLATIARAHRAAGLASPCASEPVKLAMKAMTKTQSVRQRQARALGWEEIKKFIETAGEGIRADRERALLCVAYDTMARRSELVALDVEDIELLEDGTGRALIRRSKTDQAGEGSVAYLARETVRHLVHWLEEAGVKEGAVFRRLIGRHHVGERLHADQISDIYKRVGRWIGLAPGEVEQVSGHSIRVGATQDLLALNIDLASVMQAGRWKTAIMPARYGERVLAERGGIARAAELQLRN